MSVRLLTGHDLWKFLQAAGNQVLSQADAVRRACTRVGARKHVLIHACSQAGRKPFHYLRHDAKEHDTQSRKAHALPIRSDEEIAELLVEAGMLDKSLAQVLLQQATEHGYALTCQRLIAECGANPDACSEEDSRIAREIGIGASDQQVREYFATVGMFLNKFKLEKSLHVSATCNLVGAIDVSDPRRRRVVLKTMANEDQFERELVQRGWQKQGDSWTPPSPRDGLDPSYIMAIEGVFSGEATRAAVDEENKKHAKDDEFQPLYPFILVMERADCDLAVVALKERLDLLKSQRIGREVAVALRHLHGKKVIHGDVKLLNLVRLPDRKIRAIDLDAAVMTGEPVTPKSSHRVMPPENLARLHGAISARSVEDDPLMAEATFDIWSFGTVMFELAARQPPFNSNGDGSLEQFELERLANWSLCDLANAIDTLLAVLRAVPDRGLVLGAVDLISWCLQPDPRAPAVDG